MGRVEAAPARQALHAVEAVEAEAVRAREEVRVREQLEAALAPQQLVHRTAEHVFWLLLGRAGGEARANFGWGVNARTVHAT